MKSYTVFYVCLMVAFLSFGCERSFNNEIVSSTPPELHVFVENGSGTTVSNATVRIYSNENDFANNQNAIKSETTDNNGKVVLTESTLGEPGTFYVRASNNGMSGEGETPYLLMNDGITYFTVTIQ